MDEQQFKAQLRADGYTKIEKQILAARPGKGRRRHLFAIRGLVLSGTSTSRWIQSPSFANQDSSPRWRKDNCTTSSSALMALKS